MGSRATEGGEGSRSGRKVSPWEWVAAGISALLVFGTVSVLLYEALARPPTPPVIEIVRDTVVEAEAGGYLVRFRAHNRGNSTAAGLVVEGELKSDTGSVEKGQVTIDYVPARASRVGGLFFSHDPRDYTVEIRPKGYDQP